MSFIYAPASANCSKLEDHENFNLLPYTAGFILWPILLLITAGLNLIAIMFILHLPTLKTKIVYQLLVSKYCSNILFGSAVIAEDLDELVNGVNVLCIEVKIIYFFQLISAMSGIWTTFTLSAVRLRKLTTGSGKNSIAPSVDKKAKLRLLLLSIWVSSGFLPLIPILFKVDGLLALPYCICVCLILVTVALDFTIYNYVRGHRLGNMISSQSSVHRTEKLIMASTLLLLVGWLPSMTVGVLHHFISASEVGKYCILVMYKTALLQPIIEPIVFIFVTKDIKKIFRRGKEDKSDSECRQMSITKTHQNTSAHIVGQKMWSFTTDSKSQTFDIPGNYSKQAPVL